MKKLSIEQKAQRYDEAIKKVKDALNDGTISSNTIACLQDIFPELKESVDEDERIRKELIDFVKLRLVGFPQCEKFIAWLEKQGKKDEEILILKDQIESLHAAIKAIKETHRIELEKQGEQIPIDEIAKEVCKDKVSAVAFLKSAGIMNENGELAKQYRQGEQKPADKFHEGDWVVYKNDICQIVKREEGCNKLVTKFGIEKELVNERNLSTARLWTIQDAKDGDVLAVDNMIFIYEKTLASHIVSYCKLINDIFEPFDDARTCCECNPYVHPATKEQRDFLFQKMHEASYEWDAEKKELKKIEPKPVPKFKIGDTMRTLQEAKDGWTDGIPFVVSIDSEYYNCNSEKIAIKDQYEYEYPPMNRKHENCDSCDEQKPIEDRYMEGYLNGTNDALKTLKPTTWSEEDESMRTRCIGILGKCYIGELPTKVEEELNWLKSLSPQSTWKPSDRELGAILTAIGDERQKGSDVAKELLNIYQQLKKLKQ